MATTPTLLVSSSERTRLTAPVVCAFYALLTIAMTWPQAAHLESIPDHVDSWFNMWRLAWVAHQLPRAPLQLFDANIYYPARHTLALSDAIPLPALAAAPLVWLGAPVVVACNLLVLGSFVVCALGAFLLVRSLTGRADAGVVAGLVFGFAPFRFDHYQHLELLWAQWMPLTLWAVHRTLASGRVRDGLLAGVFFAAQVFSCIYYAVFFATALVLVAPLLVWSAPFGRRRRAVVVLAGGALLAGIVAAPYASVYRSTRAVAGERSEAVASLFSAGPTHYFTAMPRSLLYGRLIGLKGREEKRLFPGFAVLALAGLAPILRRDRLTAVYALLALIAVVLSAGPPGLLFGWLRDHLVVYRGLRVPARAACLALLAFAVLAGFSFAHLATAAGRIWRRADRVLGLAIAGVVVAEYLTLPLTLIPVATEPSAVYRWLRQQSAAPVVELPLPASPGRRQTPASSEHDSEFQYLSTFHWYPLVNGYSGTPTPAYDTLRNTMVDFPDDDSVGALRTAGVRFLIVHGRFYGPGGYRVMTDALDARADLVACGRFADYGHEAKVYLLREGSR